MQAKEIIEQLRLQGLDLVLTPTRIKLIGKFTQEQKRLVLANKEQIKTALQQKEEKVESLSHKERVEKAAKDFIDRGYHLALPMKINGGTICEQYHPGRWLEVFVNELESPIEKIRTKAQSEVYNIMLAIWHYLDNQQFTANEMEVAS